MATLARPSSSSYYLPGSYSHPFTDIQRIPPATEVVKFELLCREECIRQFKDLHGDLEEHIRAGDLDEHMEDKACILKEKDTILVKHRFIDLNLKMGYKRGIKKIPDSMAMSFCSNWGTLQHLNPEMISFQQREAELARELLGLHDNITPQNNFIDPFLEPDDFLYSENYTHLLPYFSSPDDPLVSLSSEIFPSVDDFECYQYPKRQKSYGDLYYSDFVPSCFDGYVPNSCQVPEFFPAEVLLPWTTELKLPAVYSGGDVESVRKPGNGCLSVQSIAARQRRRKITEKTQELGKLIPGGNKMNTAEMFQAAFKYVKYLQAQVGILELMGSIQESKEALHVEELQVLLASTPIQEKLYSEEKCLVPKEFVETLGRDHEIQSHPLISKDLSRFIQ
ncbi:hypothetical protein HHK36_000738 [Tetracentron sinense]|uniref:BHLH domain-containing protein n=1 Tax=Tetracentron sinense TaxID=13715 RepID=A0A835DQ97_TETSI|nr:hypothetical protein HHK36_000738 [Tetracentron sinense]